jgi:hypothetical protein
MNIRVSHELIGVDAFFIGICIFIAYVFFFQLSYFADGFHEQGSSAWQHSTFTAPEIPGLMNKMMFS